MKVLLMHRSPVIARGLKLLVESSGGDGDIHEWRNGNALRLALDESQPDVVLFDPEIPGVASEQLTSAVSAWNAAAAVVVISMDESSAHMEEAISAGAQGYVSLHSSPDELIASLRLLAEGHVVATSPGVGTLADVVPEGPPQHENVAALTPREKEIAALVGRGMSNRELAERLFLTEGTVKVHLRNIFRKLGMVNRAELAVHAHRSGLVA